MASEKQTVWVIHSGKDREAHFDFAAKEYISLGWSRLGNLRLLKNDRKAFRMKFRKHYPEDGSAAIEIKAGELYRFLHEMKLRDFVIYPSGKDGLVRVGRVRGNYRYRPRMNRKHPHVRKVKWLEVSRRDTLPSEAKRGISGRLSLYQPDLYAEDVRTALLP